MRLKGYFVCLFLVTAIAAFLVDSAERSFGCQFSAGKCRGRRIAFASGVRCRSGLRFIVFSSDDDRSQSRAGRTAREIHCPRPRHHSTHDHRRNRSGCRVGAKRNGGARGEAQIRQRIGGRQANLPVRRIHGRKNKTASSCFVRSAGRGALQTKKEKRRRVGNLSSQASQEESSAASSPPETRGGRFRSGAETSAASNRADDSYRAS